MNKKAVRKLKKILAIALAFLITFQIAVPASASTKTPSEDEIIAEVQESLLSKEATGFDIQTDGDRVESITNARGVSIDLKYNEWGQLEKLTGEDIDVDISVYESGLVKSYKDNISGKEFAYTYDENGNPTSVVNDDYHYELAFTEEGNPLELIRDDQLQFASELDENGNVAATNFGNGQRMDYSFVHDYLPGAVTEAGEELYTFQYDEKERTTKVEYKQTGESIAYSYGEDAITEEHSDGTVIENEVNELGRVLSKEILSESGYSYDLRYRYDGDDILTQVLAQDTAFSMTRDRERSDKAITSDRGEITETLESLYDGDVLTGYQFRSNSDVYDLALDDDGFIGSVALNGNPVYSFGYDRLSGQLSSYMDYGTNRSYSYQYDDNGNLLSKTVEDLKTGKRTTAEYRYGNEEWADQLTSFDGKELQYDAIGNLTNYDGAIYTWEQGNKLSTIENGDSHIQYFYDENGSRTGKVVNGAETIYTIDGYKVLKETTGGHELVYIYLDEDLLGFYFDGTLYYYKTNHSGDIVGIYDEDFNEVVSYSYDIWGNPQGITGPAAETVGKYNPYRYRSYRFDEETGLYYLYSRYYNPEIGRFISADIYVGDAAKSPLQNNLYAYCYNNPVSYSDPYGYFVITISTVVAVGSFLICTYLVAAVGTYMINEYGRQFASGINSIYNSFGGAVSSALKQLQKALTEAASKANTRNYKHPTNNHHIVAQNAPRAVPAKTQYLNVWKNGINHSRNLVTIKTSLHVHLHTTPYYDSVNAIIAIAYGNAAYRTSRMTTAMTLMKNVIIYVNRLCP